MISFSCALAALMLLINSAYGSASLFEPVNGAGDSHIDLPLWPLIVGLAFLWFGVGGFIYLQIRDWKRSPGDKM